MKRAVLVLLFLGGILYSVPSLSQKATNCSDAIKVATKVVHTSSSGMSDGKIELKAESGTSLDTYNFFLTRIGSNDTVLSAKDEFKDLRSGRYDLYIIDRKGCSKQLQVEVK